ncbi:hypothetical protein [Planosporangium mesophilum]|uniref:Uncharacterized protein n=1 Tax=Planosporangium mesophilum TaxID=689768 RepID=A0A8J3X351_9ACTN|nr:hypothetical protein [Planosporangium mesophilum]NJC82410.1 hypothetical protein [Planosporangium mesophilum]GII26212.1 hypothetical protein Pme01_58090 [Planosporangium mesophilum]
MNDVTELVDLPDPAVQPLVHPLDLPEARRPFRISWLIAALTGPPVGLCVAALVWFASHSYVGPLLAGATLIGFGHLASRYFRAQAWEYIPRKRQDRQRPLPAAWELASGLVFAAALAAALLLLAYRLDRPDVAVEVREFTIGMGAAAAALVVIDFLGTLLRRPRSALFTLPAVVAVVVSIAVAYAILLDSARGPSATLWWGVGTMLVAGAGIGAWKLASSRSARG